MDILNIQCTKCGRFSNAPAINCGYCGAKFYPPLAVGYHVLNASVGFLAAFLMFLGASKIGVRPQLLEGPMVINMHMVGIAIGAIVSISWRQRGWISLPVSFIVSGLFAPWALLSWLCLLPMVILLGFLLVSSRISAASKQTKNIFLVAWIIFIEFGALLILFRSGIFTSGGFFTMERLPAALAFFLTLLIVGFPLSVVYLRRRRDVILKTWLITSARVLSTEGRSSGGDVDAPTWYVTFEYVVTDKYVSSTSTIGNPSGYKPGDTIAIRYNPDKPKSAVIDAEVSSSLNSALVLFPLFIWGIFTFLDVVVSLP